MPSQPTVAAVVGSGVVGLTCAIRLKEAGYHVTVLTKDKGPGLASDMCGGLWEPFHIEPAEIVRPWCSATYAQLKKDAERPDVTGVRLWKCFHSFGPGQEEARDCTPWWAEDVGLEVLTEGDERLSGRLPAGYCGAWFFNTYVANMTIYMPYLQSTCASLGIAIKIREGTSLEDIVGHAIEELAGSDPSKIVVINCSGLGARQLCGDAKVRPGRGVVVKVRRPQHVDAVYTDMLHEAVDESRPTYAIPNGEYITLGGSYELDNWDTGYAQEEAHDVVARCCRQFPGLKGAPVSAIWAGLRPVREAVRCDVQEVLGVQVIHAYGHGGAGVTASWGCADYVTELVRGLSSS